MYYPLSAGERLRGVLCIGRSGVDLYPEQYGCMEEVASFSKHVGGSPANIAVQLAKLDVDTAFCGMVSRDALGRYAREFLASCGVDVSHVLACESANVRQSLAIAQQRAKGEIDYFFYRSDPADLHLSMNDIDEAFLREFRILLVSGASLSASPAREAVLYAMDVARRNHAEIVFDPDYRRSGWSSTREAALYYNLAAQSASVICATREEMDVIELHQLPSNDSDERSAARLFEAGARMVCIKHGGDGSRILLPDGSAILGKPMPARVQKSLGAGDSYLGTLVAQILKGKPLETAITYASSAAAITISGRSCSDSMPDTQTLESYMRAYQSGAIERWEGWDAIRARC